MNREYKYPLPHSPYSPTLDNHITDISYHNIHDGSYYNHTCHIITPLASYTEGIPEETEKMGKIKKVSPQDAPRNDM